MESLKQGTVVL